jgi:hypothetical protein
MLSFMVKKPLIANKFRAATALVAIAAVGSFASPVLAGAAPSGKSVSFSAQFSGKASLLIENSSVKISSVNGSGKSSLFGTSKVSGSGSAPKSSSSECDPFGGKGAITAGANKISFTVTQSSSQKGCANGYSGPVTVSFHGVAVATGGSGKGSGAAGSLKFSGTLHLGGTSGSQNGSFTVNLSGKLTVKS